MSWDLNADIYVKNCSNWKCLAHDKNINTLKIISDARGDFLSEEISDASIGKEDRNIIDRIMEQFNPTVYDFVGLFTKEVFENLDVRTRFENWEDGSGYVVSNEDAEKIGTLVVPVGECMKMSEEERNSLISVYTSHTEERGYGRGKFYREQDFSSYLVKKETEYNKLLEKKFRLDSLLYSVDYLKLNDEEKETVKENIDSNYEYIDDSLDEIKSQIYAANSAMAIIDFFNNYEYDDIVMYIYAS